MGKYFIALVLALSLNAMLMLAQISMQELNPEAEIDFFDQSKSPIGSLDKGNYTLDVTDGTGIPEAGSSSSGFFTAILGEAVVDTFTDIFRVIGDWFKGTAIGKLIAGTLTAVPNYLKLVFPTEVAYILGAMWHLLTVFLGVQVLFGRD